jgi:hypothetical protein
MKMKSGFTERLRGRASGFLSKLCPLLLLVFLSCERIYEWEGDCDPHWKVKFVYDRNMKFTDAFPGAMGVGSVRLWVFDAATGEKVLEKSARAGADGFAKDYAMPVEELRPGRYRFVAWCGTDGNGSFVPGVMPGMWDATARAWSVAADVLSGSDKSVRRLKPIYYGVEEFEITDEQGEHYVPISLTKDTNEINLTLQHRSRAISPADFDIAITDDNGTLLWDNTPVGEPCSYHPWHYEAGVVETAEAADDETEAGGDTWLSCDISFPRMLLGAGAGTRLSIKERQDGRVVFDFNLVKYLLLPGFHKHLLDAHNNTVSISDQDYLDREDTWQMYFFLDDSDKGGWFAFEIHILGWVIKDEGEIGLS